MNKTETASKKSYRNSSSNEWERQVAKARAIDIRTMCERLGVELVKHGDDKGGESWYGTCPICEDLAPGFHVSPQKAGGRGLYFCRTCGSGGDSLSLFMAVRKTSFPEAVRELSDG
jgi:DNA primase